MNDRLETDLSRRERQIMAVIYRLGRASAAEVMDLLPEAPGYSAVRTLLRILVEKGHLTHRQEGPRYVYEPVIPAGDARTGALTHVVDTFFQGSVGKAVAALLGDPESDLSDADLARIRQLIENARNEGR